MALNRDRVLRAAVRLADKSGIESVTMRRLGKALGVEAMSLYNHVRNKDDVLDGIVDAAVGEIVVPTAAADWKTEMREIAISAHETLLRHPWASSTVSISARSSRRMPLRMALRPRGLEEEAIVGRRAMSTDEMMFASTKSTGATSGSRTLASPSSTVTRSTTPLRATFSSAFPIASPSSSIANA